MPPRTTNLTQTFFYQPYYLKADGFTLSVYFYYGRQICVNIRVILCRKGHKQKPFFVLKKYVFLCTFTTFSRVNRKVSAYLLVGIQN